jgi:hypothetical protein
LVLRQEQGTIISLYAVPNPVLKAGNLAIFWTPGVDVDLEVYNQAGELVYRMRGLAPGPATWDLTLASNQPLANGVYLIVARQAGQKTFKVFKLAVVK